MGSKCQMDWLLQPIQIYGNYISVLTPQRFPPFKREEILEFTKRP